MNTLTTKTAPAAAGHAEELHETLKADSTGARARELVEIVSRSQQVVRARMRGKHSPGEFKAAENLAAALDASERVIRQAWESIHGRRLH